MVRKIAFSVWLALLIVPFSAQGLGLGEITLNSALNQPLDADIELLSVEQEDLATLTATMASRDLFARYGLDRASFLDSISLDVRSRTDGRQVIHVSSNRSISEPFVTMLIELNWGRGHMLREYTVLLDPPIFAAQPAQPAPTPVAPTPRATTGTVVRVPVPIAEPEAESEPEYRQPAMPSALPAAGRPDEYMVQRHDTLWELSRDMRPAGTEINQMMIAMFRANPDAFYGNINRLKAGVILRIPDSVEMADINRAAANDQVRRHMAEWRGGSYVSGVEDSGRLRLVPADSSSVGGAGADEALTQALADQTTDNLRLREQIEELSGRIDDQERLLQLRDSELARLQSQAAASLAADDTRIPIDDAATTAEPDDATNAAVADDAGVETADETTDITADVVADTTADTTTDTTAADTSTISRPVPSVVTRPRSSPSLMERAIDLAGNQWLWIGLGVVVLTMGGLVFARRRREESVLMEAIVADELYERDEPESTGTARIQTIKPAPDDGFVVEESVVPDADPFADTIAEEGEKDEVEVDLDSTMPGVEVDLVDLDQTISGETQINLEGADPLAEADFHMAYGLYDQAADLVQKALDKNPERHEFRNKLAEIFFVWGNKDSFLETAQYLHDNRQEMAAGEWDKIVIMGRQIDPDSHLFAGESGAGAVGIVDMPLEETKVSEVDVDLLMGDEGDEESAVESEMTEFDDVFADAADAGEDDLLGMGEGEEEELDVSGLAAAEMGEDADLDEAISAAADDDDDLEATSQTAELNIDDLGLDDELDLTGTMQIVDLEDQEEDVGHDTVQIRNKALQQSEDEGLDFEFGDKDEPAAVDPGKTAEMPVLSMDDVDDDDEEQMFTDVFGDDDESRISDNLDLDIGADFDSTDKDDTLAQTTEMTREMEAVDEGDDLEHTGTMRLPPDLAPADATGLHDVTGIHEATIVDEDYTGTIKLPDAESEAETMSEVGTKLDLARAYVDMGDPDGARSILEEVLEEGNEPQKVEAQTLLDSLS